MASFFAKTELPLTIQHTSHAQNWTRTSLIADCLVINHLGDELGMLTDYVVDLHSGTIVYGVLVRCKYLCLHERYYAIPFGALTYMERSKVLLLEIESHLFDADRGFDKKHWPDEADLRWLHFVQMHYAT